MIVIAVDVNAILIGVVRIHVGYTMAPSGGESSVAFVADDVCDASSVQLLSELVQPVRVMGDGHFPSVQEGDHPRLLSVWVGFTVSILGKIRKKVNKKRSDKSQSVF